ncbi:MAG: ATP-binding protein [Propionibacteriaceae bacterium]|nr:ATP-binding protein [Propionibacteriaceae bacterium]
MIRRVAAGELEQRLQEFSGAMVLGPRQVGKTTLARQVADSWPAGSVYLDLERPADRRRLADADSFLRMQAPRLVVLDEVHRVPEIFATLRGVIDDNRRQGFRTGQFLLLGSASLDVLKGVDESLAGRVSHLRLAGVAPDEAADSGVMLNQLWLRGGFPDSLLASSDAVSMRWREDLVTSYLERDIPMFAPRVPAETLRRLWMMIANASGGLFNASRLAENLSVSSPTVSRYVDLLADLGLVRRLQPWFANLTTRLTKSDKVYVRDTGLLHSLLGIDSQNALLGHPVVGGSFESLAVESLTAAAPTSWHPYFFRTARGDEIDLVFAHANRVHVAIEVKASSAPVVSAGFHRSCDALGVSERFIVHPDTGADPYRMGAATVIGLTDLVRRWRPVAG